MAYARGKRFKSEFERAMEHAFDIRAESTIRRESEKEDLDESAKFLRLQGRSIPLFYLPEEPYETEEEKAEKRKRKNVRSGKIQL